MLHGFLHEGYIDALEESLQARGVKVLDIGLTSPFRGLVLGNLERIAVVVSPGRVEVQTEHVTLGLLQGLEDFLKISQTVSSTRTVIAALPAVIIEPHARRVHHTVQHHMVTMSVNQPLAFHVKRRQRHHSLCPQSECSTGSKNDSNKSLHCF